METILCELLDRAAEMGAEDRAWVELMAAREPLHGWTAEETARIASLAESLEIDVC